MPTNDLSPREEEIVQLCIDGLTNEEIAHRLGISVGTINTHWLRITFKVGGIGKTDTIAKLMKDRAELALRNALAQQKGLSDIIAEREANLLQYRVGLALLQVALDAMKSAVWATDTDLYIQVIATGDYPSEHLGVQWEAGKTVYEIFQTQDEDHPAVVAHREALQGKPSETNFVGYFKPMHLRVVPLYDDEQNEVLGSISILSTIPE